MSRSADGDEDPTVLLWALVYAAQHYAQVGKLAEAFKLIDEAIAHTPTIIDLYVFKSRFFKARPLAFNYGALKTTSLTSFCSTEVISPKPPL